MLVIIGALGFSKSPGQVFPGKTRKSVCRHQRCTVHKTANLLNKAPKSIQSQVKRDLREVWTAPAKLMAFKLIMTAAKTWRRLKGDKPLPKVVESVTFIDGVEAVIQSTNVVAQSPVTQIRA